MKKIIIIIIILAAAILFYAMRNTFPIDKTGSSAMSENSVFRADPTNATFIFDDGPITLSAGRDERTVVSGSALTEEIVLLDKFAYGDVNRDSKEDTVLLLARYGAGSGVFIYAAAFISGPVTYRGSEAIFIGDRIAPQSISINQRGIVTVKYLDRALDESFAAEPTVPASKQLVYKNGEFVER